VDWPSIEESLDADGFARLPVMLSPDDCVALQGLYRDEAKFRSRVDMARFRFGVGEYKYFAAPLPAIVQTLREELYGKLAPIANRWMARLKTNGTAADYPDTLEKFLRKCHAAGETRPTPLLLSYIAGGYNCLHQDLYGELAFPLQVVFVLARAGVDYTGGELVLVEQRPRAQSRGHAIAVEQGAAVVSPLATARSAARFLSVVMRHGVSDHVGARMSLGIIFTMRSKQGAGGAGWAGKAGRAKN
jgi:hypothetical protein